MEIIWGLGFLVPSSCAATRFSAALKFLCPLKHTQEQANLQHRTQQPESSQLFPLQRADASQDCRAEPVADGKGVVVVLKKRAGQRKPATTYEKITINKHARATLNSLRHIIRKNNDRKDLRTAALHRASAILRSQKPVVVKKKRAHTTKTP
uniref:Uncharacterized protein n=1 Tax=Sphaerodactylus townsendi TaxID=933632 RepID=A0ACB8G9S4_9SAUR